MACTSVWYICENWSKASVASDATLRSRYRHLIACVLSRYFGTSSSDGKRCLYLCSSLCRRSYWRGVLCAVAAVNLFLLRKRSIKFIFLKLSKIWCLDTSSHEQDCFQDVVSRRRCLETTSWKFCIVFKTPFHFQDALQDIKVCFKTHYQDVLSRRTIKTHFKTGPIFLLDTSNKANRFSRRFSGFSIQVITREKRLDMTSWKILWASW